MNALYWVLLITSGFLLGNIMFCEIIPKRLVHKDIYEISDDHNPGAFNVFKHCGKVIGMLCLVLDILKGFIPVFLASMFMETNGLLFTLVMIAPVFGHAVGIFNHFHGGKCIATSFGVMLGILPVTWVGFAFLAALFIVCWLTLTIIPTSYRSIVVYGLFVIGTSIACSIMALPTVAAGCGIISLIAITKHLKIKELVQRRVSKSEK